MHILKNLTILVLFLFCSQHSWAVEIGSDTTVVHVVNFNTPSPEGWGAHYKELVKFPDSHGPWAKIMMVQTLKCDSATKGDKYPCGEWDYIWDTYLEVPQKDTFEIFSLGSFITPYGKRLWLGGEKGWQWTYDITNYAPILKGEMNITTGNNQELLDLKFLFIKGKPVREVLSVENLYPYGDYKYKDLADDSVLTSREIQLLPEAKGYQLKARISGHGHFGPRNCCEWDNKTHTYFINKFPLFRWNVWKDCGNNPIYPQGGTWPFDRAGWCPGTKVDEYEFELTPHVHPGDTLKIDYGIEMYTENGESGGNYKMSHQLFSFGAPNSKNDGAIEDIIAPSSKDEYSRINPICANPRIIIKNTGANTLKTLTITYGLKQGQKSTFTWNGNLAFLEKTEVWLPTPDWTGLEESSEFVVELSMPNGVKDENPINNKLTSQVKFPQVLPSEFILQIKTNNLGRAKENAYTLSNENGDVLYADECFEDDTEYNIPIKLKDGCYEFLFTDKNEDGISVHWWYRKTPEKIGKAGKVSILTVEKEEIHTFKHDFGEELKLNFRVGEN